MWGGSILSLGQPEVAINEGDAEEGLGLGVRELARPCNTPLPFGSGA